MSEERGEEEEDDDDDDDNGDGEFSFPGIEWVR